ncbi:hypothetical protein JS533_012900, partial [Bifidobacterium amazonense]
NRQLQDMPEMKPKMVAGGSAGLGQTGPRRSAQVTWTGFGLLWSVSCSSRSIGEVSALSIVVTDFQNVGISTVNPFD